MNAIYAPGDLVSVSYADDRSVVVRATALVASVEPTSPAWRPSEQWWTVRCDKTPGRETVAWVVDSDGRIVLKGGTNGGGPEMAPDGLPWICRVGEWEA